MEPIKILKDVLDVPKLRNDLVSLQRIARLPPVLLLTMRIMIFFVC